MIKYLIFSFLLISTAGWLIAQDQDTLQNEIKIKEAIDTPEIKSPINDDRSGEIIITGPTGEIVNENPANENPVIEEELVDSEQEETQNSEGPKIIYYQSENHESEDRQYRSKSKKSDIKTLAGSMNHSGGFGAISFRYSDFRDESLVMAGIRGGWIVNRTLGIGFEGHGVIPTSRYEDIEDSRDVVLVGGYGGMFLELIFFSNQVIHVTFPVSAGAGWLGYTEHWENDFTNPPYQPGDSLYVRRDQLVDDDTFWYIEPGANLELNVSRNFRMCFGVSKRFTQDFQLQNTAIGAFDKPNYYVTLKFGRF